VAAAVLVTDAASKLWAVYSLPYLRRAHGLPGLGFFFVLNSAPSFAVGHASVERLLPVVVKFVLLVWAAWRLAGWYRTLGLGLIVGGSLGNLTSFAVGHAVVDFLVMPWATVNLADLAIVVGSAVVGVGVVARLGRCLGARSGPKANSSISRRLWPSPGLIQLPR
jgi:signal peptidase II